MRYIILVLLNLPIILLAFLSTTTKYKLGKIDKKRYIRQIVMWTIILIVIISSFPVYNLLLDKPVFDSIDLSSFDIIEITTIIILLYEFNSLQQKIEHQERRLRDIHEELSIKLSNE